jgi:hypothetical protein
LIIEFERGEKVVNSKALGYTLGIAVCWHGFCGYILQKVKKQLLGQDEDEI